MNLYNCLQFEIKNLPTYLPTYLPRYIQLFYSLSLQLEKKFGTPVQQFTLDGYPKIEE